MTVQLDIGSWGLFCGHDGRQLVLVDDIPCGPSSARKCTRRIPRELLLDEGRVARAHATGTTLTETVVRGGKEWLVTVQPVLSPHTSSVVGVLASVSQADARLPPAPLIGAWEWVIDRQPDGQPSSRRRTYWSRNLFHLYDVDPGVAQQRQGYWEAGEWASELIDRSDQMRVYTSIRDGIQQGLQGITGVIRCLTYNIVTGYGSATRGRKHLRLVGMVVPVEPGDDKILLQGFSYEVPDSFQDVSFEQDATATRVDDVLRGVMALAREPMAIVDVDTLDILMTSASWRRADLGHVGGLGEFAGDDAEELHAFIKAAATDTERSSSMHVSLNRTDGTAQSFEMTVTGVKCGVVGRDAVIRLDL